MSELGPDIQALLDAARDAHDPTAADRARVKQGLVNQLGAGAFATQVPMGPSARPWLRFGAGAAAVGLAIVAGLMLRPATPSANPPPPAPQVTSVTPLSAPQTPVVLDPPSVPVESLHAVPVQAQPVAKLAPSEESTLEKELLLLRDAKSALDRGDSAKALSVLDQHEKTYPDGVLAEERGATRVLALCAAGRTQDAKLSARDFLAKYPRSPSAVRVRASCGAP
jgi:hypothetical protein